MDLLLKWQAKMNLIGKSTADDAWRRHVVDSLQLVPLLKRREGTILDIGSGAGLPGIPLAITLPAARLHLVESNTRKAAFLREAVRVTECHAVVHNRRMEDLTAAALPRPVDAIVSRATAPIGTLLDWAAPLAEEGTQLLFPKGQDVDAELTDATKYWRFTVQKHPSRLQRDSWIVEIGNPTRVPGAD